MVLKYYKGTLITLSIAVFLYLFSFMYYNRYDWVPVETPITKLGYEVTSSFKAQLDANYRVIIEFDQINRPLYWVCIYGSAIDLSQCEDNKSFAVANWSVNVDEKELAAGVSEGQGRGAVWGRGYAGSRVTSFEAREGGMYTVAVSLTGPEGILEETNPRIKVELPASLHKSTFALVSLLSLAAHFIVGISVVVYFIEHYRKWRYNNRLQDDAASPRA